MTPTLWMTALTLSALLAQPEARVIDQGVEDISPIATSSRIAPKDFRKPTGFEKVYEITTPDGKTVYARIDNGIAAVFTRSDYSARGEALIPPNTVFHIGTSEILASHAAPMVSARAAPNRVDTRVQTDPAASKQAQAQSSPPSNQSAEPAAASPEAVPGPPSIVTNEIYRRLRITQLLQDAAEPA